MIFRELFYENNQPANDLLLVRQAGEVLEDANYTISRSGSQTHVIGTVLKGLLRLEWNRTAFTVKPGQSIYLPRGVDYLLQADPHTPPHFYWVNLRGRLMNSIAEELFGQSCTVADFNLLPGLQQLRGLLQSPENNQAAIAPLILQMLLQLTENTVTPTRLRENFSEYELYISNHIQSQFSVAKMAAHFHCSTDTLNRLFLKEFKTTPYRYYQKMRLNIACSLLLKTSMTVEDIATRLHFYDRNYFSLYFKKQIGKTPVQYKKLNQ